MAKKKSKIFVIKNVIKSTGTKEPFDWKKIERSVVTAGKDTKEYSKEGANKILIQVESELKRKKNISVSTRVIRNIIEPVMAECGYFKTARYYILYNERKTKKKKKFKIWEPKMVKNARAILVGRCSKHGDNGDIVETPGQIFWRVAKHVAKAEVNWGDEHDVEKYARLFYEKMANFKFVCSGSALSEAGNDVGYQQLSSCFVLPIEDSIQSIFKTLGQAALVQKNYGGTGFNFSKIRFKGDRVRSVPDAASGPVDFLQVFSAALSKVVQGSRRHGGNMGILNVNHPDIESFIKVKDEDGNMKNFNISVGISDQFMEAVIEDKKYDLINPRDGSKVKSLKAKNIFKKMCAHAHKSGDPGMIFLDRMEEDNFTSSLGKLDGTNPCGEQPLLPYESCNLSSIHLANHLVNKNGKYEIDWEDLSETVHLVVRFLDNMIEINSYVLPEIENMVKHGNRKIGLGVLGFAEVLYKMGVAYNSHEGVRFAEKIAKFIKKEAESASLRLAVERGVFPNWDISSFRGTAEKYRNCTMITIAPTGTVSMIGNTTSGIEPSFALVYEKRSFYNKDHNNRSTASFYYVEPIFEKALKEKGIYSRELIDKVAQNEGSVHGMEEIPEDIRKTFVTAHDIVPKWHIKIQSAFQKYVDNAVSKTINFANSATVRDVEKAYLLAYKTGCKGITIYRDGSKDNQVLRTGNGKKEGKDKKVCPECKGVLFQESGCETCRDCGWSKCKL
ncbi:adenosylcobalamin-dependent ribonucleoside-diphosphate reductase [Patescibacteria group bacterium]|nr:adenosylcobalamin-dependent ribonucleoside-diphosphate reductase [Patescibacteria group bacterium]